MNILLRDLKWDDLKALEDVIRVTWNYDRFASPKTAKKLAKVYLASCLANQTFSRIAEADGLPVGVILGKDIENHHCPFKYRMRQILGIIQLLMMKEGRQLLKFYQAIDGVDQKLLEQCDKPYKGEVALFALSPEYRGLGLGKQLFHSLLQYMAQKGIPSFYLFTDTSCNFGFYEHQGMIRRQQYRCTVSLKGQTATMEFYLYDRPVAKEGNAPSCKR